MPLDPHVSRATEPWKSGLRHPSRHGRESSIFEENNHGQDPIVIYIYSYSYIVNLSELYSELYIYIFV